MSIQPVKRLSSLEIDEVSLVDRPANQHGLVTITKRDEGLGMGVYDEAGNELDENDLESGDMIQEEDGSTSVLLSDDDLQAIIDGEVDPAEFGLTDEAIEALLNEENLAEVGKSEAAAVTGGPSTLRRWAMDVKGGYKHGRRGEAPERLPTNNHLARGSAHVGRNKNAYIVGASAGTEENVRGRMSKSLGEQVLTDLSKALTDGDRDQVISKMADRLSEAEEVAKAAQEHAAFLQDQAEFAQYVDIAKSFELPVDPEDLGSILQEVSKVLSNEQLETLERIFNTAAAAISFDEEGSQGYSPTMDYVEGAAMELVGKSAGEISPEQATTALYSANDDAYLAYLSENQR